MNLLASGVVNNFIIFFEKDFQNFHEVLRMDSATNVMERNQ